MLGDFRPLFAAVVVADEPEQPQVFVGPPRSPAETGTEEAAPVLPALLGVAVAFVLGGVAAVELVGNLLPLLDLAAVPHRLSLLPHYFCEQPGLLCTPVSVGQGDFAQPQPLEHAALGRHSGDELCDGCPVVEFLGGEAGTSPFSQSAMECSSQYFDIIHTRIRRSSSPQFFLMRFVFSIF